MQMQKEEIKQAILRSAIEEFKSKGYLKASIRTIAQNAGVAVGNIYRYFESKEELFETVVLPAYNQLTYYINHHDHPNVIPLNDKRNKIIIDEQLEFFMNFVINHHDALLVLIDHSVGTKYSNAKAILLKQIFTHIKEEFGILAKKNVLVPSEGVTHAFCVAILEGLLDLARNHTNEEIFKKDFTAFLFNLFMGIMQQENSVLG